MECDEENETVHAVVWTTTIVVHLTYLTHATRMVARITDSILERGDASLVGLDAAFRAYIRQLSSSYVSAVVTELRMGAKHPIVSASGE